MSRRDCSSFCSGSGCNKNIGDVIDQHDVGNDGLTCFACQYGVDHSGNLLPNSNVDCKLPSVSGSVTAIQCPRYMDAACFTTATWDYSGDKVAEEDYKGCSGFRLDNGEEYCDQFDVNGKTVDSCKNTCDNNSCNNQTPEKRLSCYTCDVTFDSNNNVIGVGSPRCSSNQAKSC